jgi:hypothetical protein
VGSDYMRFKNKYNESVAAFREKVEKLEETN